MAIYPTDEEYDLHYRNFDYNDTSPMMQLIVSSDVGLKYIKDADIDKIENLVICEVNEELGGGDSAGPSMIWWTVIPVISFILVSVSGGFFSEIGKEVAQVVLRKFKGLPRSGIIELAGLNYQVKVLVPTNMTTKDCEILSLKLDGFVNKIKPNDESKSFFAYFNRESSELVFLHI